MAAIVELPPPAPSIPPKHMAHNATACPQCGTSVQLESRELDDAKRRIEALEAQVELLKEKATAAVDKCADYEDQIRSLQSAPGNPGLLRSNTFDSLDPSDETPRPTTANSARQSRFSFLTTRRASPNNSTSLPPPPPPPKDIPKPAVVPIDVTLLNELERERTLRAKAEARVQKVDSEIEELSVQLFSQANEMVAEERRARAKLEERVETLERRDKEKMGRLERLEKAVTRVERVKKMLGESETTAPVGTAIESGRLAPPARK